VTMSIAPLEGKIVDLTEDEAEAITGRIRQWVREFPVDDVERAFRGRIWLALGYESWAEWCDCELGGFKLPAPQRREVGVELAERDMSEVGISEVLGISRNTVRSDKAGQPVQSEQADRKTLGQDGKGYSKPKRQPKPKPVAPEPEPTPGEPGTPDSIFCAKGDYRKSVSIAKNVLGPTGCSSQSSATCAPSCASCHLVRARRAEKLGRR
jgi:hypothetical protein